MTPASNSETPESNSNLNPVLPENPEQNSPSPISNLDDISQDIDLSTELGEEKENQLRILFLMTSVKIGLYRII